MAENKLFKEVFMTVFMALGVMMYYFITEVINLGIFVTFRHAFALGLFFLAVLSFLIKPNVARGIQATKSAFIYSMPLVVTILVSLFIWFVTQVDTDVIARGLSGAFVYTNMLSFALAAAAFLYMFGEKGIWYNLIVILIANILMICTIILNNGLGAYFSEFIRLVTSFAADTGDIIVQAEVHELAFCLGAYLIYMALRPKRNIVFYILLFLTLFCFLSAFKRIGILAIAISLAFGFSIKFVSRHTKETAVRVSLVLSLLVMLLLIGYVFIIKMGAFDMLESAGIDTTGRSDIYNAVDKFYEFSPDFLGNGIGFLTYQLSGNMNVGVSSVHNDFLQYFIDLGFFGYILWLFTMTVLRIWSFGRGEKMESAPLVFSLMLYLIIVSATDNTMNYPLLTSVIATLMIGDGFDKQVRNRENKMFGYISLENREKENGVIL